MHSLSIRFSTLCCDISLNCLLVGMFLSGWFSKKEASRKYVDLIKGASSKWPNWDPPKTINVSELRPNGEVAFSERLTLSNVEAGDFGYINKETGIFEKEGSIYQHDDTRAIAEKFPPELKKAEKIYVINSTLKSHRKASTELGGSDRLSLTLRCGTHK
jgi:hypothetical protein